MYSLKVFLKKAICYFIYHSGLLHLYMKCVFLKRKSYPAVIINYHSFIDSFDECINPEPAVYIPVNNFRAMLDFLCRYFEIVSLDSIVDALNEGKTLDRPVVAITVDDGFKDNYEKLFPILKEYNIPATIFLAASFIDTDKKIWVERLFEALSNTACTQFTVNHSDGPKTYTFQNLEEKRKVYDEVTSWLKGLHIDYRLEQLKKIEEQLDYKPSKVPTMLNWDEVREMEKSNVYFGAHSMTHPILSRMPVDAAKKEILDSKKFIEEKLGHKVRHFAYPNGRRQDFTAELSEYCKEIGFDSISSTVWGSNSKENDRWFLKRVSPCLPMAIFAIYVLRAFLNED